MNNKRPIGIFDSGVGGLSILASVKELLPRESIVYLADQKNNPYGAKTPDEIKKLAAKVVEFLLEQNVKVIIVACNTASVNAIDYLREHFNIPIIAVVPVVKTIVEATKTGNVVVFATPATAKSEYLHNLIEKFSGGKQVFVIGTSKLEHLVEAGVVEGQEISEAIQNSLSEIKDKNVDSIALGCTHYPFLTSEIQKVIGPGVSIYDSGGAIARRTKFILEKEGILSNEKVSEVYYTTGEKDKFKKVAEKLLHEELVDVRNVTI